MRLPITARVTIWYVALLATVLSALGTYVLLRLNATLVQGVDQSLASRAAQISLGYNGQGQGQFQDVSDASLRGLSLPDSAAQVLSPTGALLDATGDPVANASMLTEADVRRVLQAGELRRTLELGPDREPFRILAVALSDNRSPGVLVVGASLAGVASSVHHVLVLLLTAGPTALGAAALGGWFLSRAALRPIANMTREAAEIESFRLSDRVGVPRTPDELQRLAMTLNSMLGRIERGSETLRQFVGDASHELRTPLAIMRSEIDVRLRLRQASQDQTAVLISLRDEVNRMTHIVDDLLVLARIDDGRLDMIMEHVELRRVTDEAVHEIHPLASRRGVCVDTEGDGVGVLGDPTRLKRVVKNLLDNAVKYSSPPGRVQVTIWNDGTEGGVTVTDSGPGIPAEATPRIFDRFFRVDASRSRTQGGSGLGLAICREIVAAHNGRIWVDSELGRGSSFSIAFPIS